MAGYTVSLSVVTHNNEEYIGDMLDSLREHIKGVPYHVYVIDNGSKDHTLDIVKRKSENVTVIQNEKNLGFGEAHNQVLSMLDSKYHLVINPDIMINSDVVREMAEYMDRCGDIGILTPKVLYPDGTVQRLPKRDPRLIYLISRRLNLSPLKKYRDEYEMAEKGQDKAFDIEFATGCFMFMQTGLFKKVNGFDKRFFLYFEDADLSRRIRRFARVEYNPAFFVYHCWERGGARNLKLFFIQIYSMFKYLGKWKANKGK